MNTPREEEKQSENPPVYGQNNVNFQQNNGYQNPAYQEDVVYVRNFDTLGANQYINPIAQPAYFYQQQPVTQNYNRSHFPIHRGNDVILMPNQPIYRMCSPNMIAQPPMNLNLYEQNKYLNNSFPVCFVIFLSILLIVLAGFQIFPECYLLEYGSTYSDMTSGWYSGGFMIGCALFGFFTTCFRTRSMIKISIIYYIFVMFMIIGFGIIVPSMDMNDSQFCDWTYNHYCIDGVNQNYDYIWSADLTKLIAGALTIKVCIVFAVHMRMFLKRRRYAGFGKYVYNQPQLIQRNPNQASHQGLTNVTYNTI